MPPECTRERRIALAGLFLILAVHLAIALRSGFFMDDLLLARYARETSWADLLLRYGTYPYQMPLWKLAVAWNPEEPYRLVQLAAVLAHTASCFFVWMLLGSFFPGDKFARSLGTLSFAFFRPGSETPLWAAAQPESLLTLFCLAGLWCWREGCRRQGAGRARLRWLAVALAVPAALSRTTGVTLAGVFLAHTWWLEGEAAPVAPRLRAAALPLAVLAGFSALIFTNAVLRSWIPEAASHLSAIPSPLAAAGALGGALARGVFLADALLAWAGEWPGWLALAGATLLLFRGPPAARLGATWAVLLLAVPVFAKGTSQPRYEYAGAFGVVLALLGVVPSAAGMPRRAGQVFLALWACANVALYARDAFYFSRCGQMNVQTRRLLRDHAGELGRAEGLQVANHPYRVRHTDVLRYDLGLWLPVAYGEECVPGRGPCISYPRPVVKAADCPGSGELPFARWIE